MGELRRSNFADRIRKQLKEYEKQFGNGDGEISIKEICNATKASLVSSGDYEKLPPFMKMYVDEENGCTPNLVTLLQNKLFKDAETVNIKDLDRLKKFAFGFIVKSDNGTKTEFLFEVPDPKCIDAEVTKPATTSKPKKTTLKPKKTTSKPKKTTTHKPEEATKPAPTSKPKKTTLKPEKTTSKPKKNNNFKTKRGNQTCLNHK